MKVILPFIEPFLTSLASYAGIFTILSGKEDQNIKLWFIHNYIGLQCRFTYPEKSRIILFDDEFGENDIFNCPLLTKHKTPRGYVEKWGGVVPFIRNQVTEGYYIMICLDRFYNPHFNNVYEIIHFNHISLIIGFDDDEEMFYAADFYGNGRYSCKTISYNNINYGFLSFDFDKELNGYEYIISARYDNIMDKVYYYRPLNITFLLTSYLEGYERDNILFGKYSYDVVIETIKKGECDNRMFHTLYDHKKAMNKRAKYLQELGFAHFDSKELNLFQQLETTGLICRNSAIKSAISQKRDQREKAIQNYIELKSIEEVCINILLSKL